MTISPVSYYAQLPNVKNFIDLYGSYACDCQIKYDIPSVAMLAQSALETGWGSHILQAYYNGVKIITNNMFNIKAGKSWQGKVGTRKVLEYTKEGKDYYIDSFFRVYDHPRDSFDNYCDYILGRKKKDGTLLYHSAIDNRDDAAQYIREVHAAGYATDPKYSDKVINIMGFFSLTV